jgi:hypothetical protein
MKGQEYKRGSQSNGASHDANHKSPQQHAFKISHFVFFFYWTISKDVGSIQIYHNTKHSSMRVKHRYLKPRFAFAVTAAAGVAASEFE